MRGSRRARGQGAVICGMWILSPLVSQKQERKKNLVRVGHPLTKLSGFAHALLITFVRCMFVFPCYIFLFFIINEFPLWQRLSSLFLIHIKVIYLISFIVMKGWDIIWISYGSLHAWFISQMAVYSYGFIFSIHCALFQHHLGDITFWYG